jgi:hypothetical protein
MQFVLDKPKQWSGVALKLFIAALIGSVVLALLHGALDGLTRLESVSSEFVQGPWFAAIMVWCTDFRYLCDQLVYSAVIFFVGAKFVETRTIFTVGFDKLDATKVSFKGPDDDNIVWIGHRYGSRLEAETVAAAIENRMKESAA